MKPLGWRELDSELRIWEQMGRKAELWLRDDDAVAPTDELDRLLSLVDAAQVPLALAVIPATATEDLARRLASLNAVSVLQHGYAHINHEVLGGKKSEFPNSRPLHDMMSDLLEGHSAITGLFGDGALPVLVPPWNRISPHAINCLFDCGISGLSRFKSRSSRFAITGVLEINTHVDLVSWHDLKAGKPADLIAAEVASQLAACRTGDADDAEAIGILSHHLVMDEVAWDALTQLIKTLSADSRVRWRSPKSLFGGT